MAGLPKQALLLGFVFAVHLFSEYEVLSAQNLERTAGGDFAFARFVRNSFQYLDVAKIGSYLVHKIGICGHMCMEEFVCFSYNVAAQPDINGHFVCELLASDMYNSSDQLLPHPDFHHYSIPSPCSENPCQNGGTCIALYNEGDFKCKCRAGFKGKKCGEADNMHQSTPSLGTDFATAMQTHTTSMSSPEATSVGLSSVLSVLKTSPITADNMHQSTPSLGTDLITAMQTHTTGMSSPEATSVGPSSVFSVLKTSSITAVPAMCVEGGGGYRVMNEPDRSELNTDQSNLKCDDSDGLTPGWVRFEGDGGTVMSTSEPPDKRCAAHAPGYLVGGHPEVQDGTVERQVCFVWQSNGCMKDVQIRVRNCGSFYVYELATLGFCKLRYCTDPASSPDYAR